MAVSRAKVSSCVIVCVSFLAVIKTCSAVCGIDGGFQCSARSRRGAEGEKPRSKIPLFLAQQLNEAETFEDMLNILHPDDVVPPVVAEEVISRKSASPLSGVQSALSSWFGTRFGGRNEVVIEPRGSKPQTAKPAKCQPMLTSVPVKQPDDPNSFYLPECVYLEQCGGCCNVGLYQCEPKDKEIVLVPVAVMKIGQLSSRRNTTLIAMEKHLKCRCDCRTKAHHCNSFQRHEACECVCTNTDDRTKCLSNPKKQWDKDRCSCSCKETEDCTTGLEFDELTCTCVRRPQPVSTRVGGRPDTTYEVRPDDRRRRRWGNTTKYTVVP